MWTSVTSKLTRTLDRKMRVFVVTLLLLAAGIQTLQALTDIDAPAKRQLDSSLQNAEDPNGVIYQHADELKQYMQTAMNAANRMDNPETYQQTIKEFMDLIDRVVASHQTTTPSF